MGTDGPLVGQIGTASPENEGSPLLPHALHPKGFISVFPSASPEKLQPFADTKVSCSGCGYAIFHGFDLSENGEDVWNRSGHTDFSFDRDRWNK
jgi:hypothetical protein